jgi:PAS domain S-box-containing protein
MLGRQDLISGEPASEGHPSTEVDSGLDAQTALVVSGHAFAVTDPRRPDDPLVWVNPAFEELTGYAAADVLGHNCRLLQGPDTDPQAVARLREALAAGRGITETLLNYRPDGSTWWNLVKITPVHDEAGVITHFVGVQNDVSELIASDRQRDEARSETVASQDRLRLVAEIGTMLAVALDPPAAASGLTRLVTPTLADWASVVLLDGEDTDRGQPLVTLHHFDAHRAADVAAVLEQAHPVDVWQNAVLRSGEPKLLDADLDVSSPPGRDRLGMTSGLIVPLLAGTRTIGCLTLVYAESGRRYADADVAFALDLGRRAGAAIFTAQRYSGEHSTALALQRSLLPALPEVDGLELAARYLPGSERAEIGGDWYDVLPLPDGSVGLAVGDVMGHDIQAAAAMGQLRSVLRSYAWEGHSPAGVLDRLNQLVCGLGMAQLATCFYARLEPDDRSTTLRWANAGHPPPLLKTADGVVHTLTSGLSPLIGVNVGGAELLDRAADSVDVPPGSTLLIYTDGLVEDRHRDIDEGIDILRNAFAKADPAMPAQELADLLITEAGPGDQDDDRCLLLVRIN